MRIHFISRISQHKEDSVQDGCMTCMQCCYKIKLPSGGSRFSLVVGLRPFLETWSGTKSYFPILQMYQKRRERETKQERKYVTAICMRSRTNRLVSPVILAQHLPPQNLYNYWVAFVPKTLQVGEEGKWWKIPGHNVVLHRADLLTVSQLSHQFGMLFHLHHIPPKKVQNRQVEAFLIPISMMCQRSV